MRIIVSGAGTAGHVSPVLAAVDALQRRAKSSSQSLEILYIGTRGGIEARLARQADLRFVAVLGGKYRRLPRASWWQRVADWRNLGLNLRDIASIGVGTLQSVYQMVKFRPDAIFNKAGVTGLPVGLAARILGVPMIIHEPDVLPGLGNKILSRWAYRVAVGFPVGEYRAFPPQKMVFTGTPVRPEILGVSQGEGSAHIWKGHNDTNSKLPTLLVMGGSLGARAINTAVIEALPQLHRISRVLLISGQADFDAVQAAARSAGATPGQCLVKPYLDAPDMAAAYAAAEIVVSRAGANSIAELAALRKPTILIPNRLMAAHQLVNAARLQEAEAALILPEETLSAETLYETVRELLGSHTVRSQLQDRIAAYNVPDAADRLAELLEQAAQHRGRA